MRTTLIVNDALFLEAKKRAAERNTSISAVVNDALLTAFREPLLPASDAPFQMPTFAPERANRVDTSPQEMAELMVAEELHEYRP
ncbi:MAG: hypothetical protein ACKO2G_01775 [Verrucomicrobiales bacterium]